MPVAHADPRNRALEILLSKGKVRLIDPSTGEFLHQSGTDTTPSLRWSWLGFLRQAAVLQKRAHARGEPWPYHPIPRDLFGKEGADQKLHHDLKRGTVAMSEQSQTEWPI